MRALVLLCLGLLGLFACLDASFLAGKECDAQGRCLAGYICNQQNRCVVRICGQDGDCDDQNPCTQDRCVERDCQYTNVEAGTACDDLDPCSVGDSCLAGFCQTGTQRKDSDSDGFVDHDCPGGDDCDDELNSCGAQCHPDAIESLSDSPSCTDGVDNDCDGKTDDQDIQCIPCSQDAQCDDGNECTDDVCQAGVCERINNTSGCDDGDSCTQQDVCLAGRCAGYNICPDQCSLDCVSGCGQTGCCIQECQGESCPACQPGCSCDQKCDTNTCVQRCLPRSVCHFFSQENARSDLDCVNATCFFDCEGSDECNLKCKSESVCEMRCNASDTCTLECSPDASCTLTCISTDTCVLACADGPITCAEGVQVCGRECP